MRLWNGDGSFEPASIVEQFQRYGALLLRNIGLDGIESPADIPESILEALGFGDQETFGWGGSSCGRTHRSALSTHLRSTDAYPPHLWLLPHNEVLYQRNMPSRLLFCSATASESGGRTFVHSARGLQDFLG